MCRQGSGCTASRNACLADPACAPVPRGELGPIFPFVVAPAVFPAPIKSAADDGPKNEAEDVHDPGFTFVADGWEGDVQGRNGDDGCSACSCKVNELTCSDIKCTDTRTLIAAVIKRAGINAKDSKFLTDTIAGLEDDTLDTFLSGNGQERRPDISALLEDSTVKSALETAGVDVNLLSGLLEHHVHDVDEDADVDVDGGGDGDGDGEAPGEADKQTNDVDGDGDAIETAGSELETHVSAGTCTATAVVLTTAATLVVCETSV